MAADGIRFERCGRANVLDVCGRRSSTGLADYLSGPTRGYLAPSCSGSLSFRSNARAPTKKIRHATAVTASAETSAGIFRSATAWISAFAGYSRAAARPIHRASRSTILAAPTPVARAAPASSEPPASIRNNTDVAAAVVTDGPELDLGAGLDTGRPARRRVADPARRGALGDGIRSAARSPNEHAIGIDTAAEIRLGNPGVRDARARFRPVPAAPFHV